MQRLFSDDFQVGFNINDDTNFSFAPVPFTPLGGTIEHDGTITVALGEAQATIGEFSIGFDPTRRDGTASGFFVADTLADPLNLDILFDIGMPETISLVNEDFSLADADLLLAPELATALGLPNLAGADVGDTRVDGIAEEVIMADDPLVRFRNETVAGSYLYASEAEAIGIRENFSDVFTEEGDAFNVSLEQEDGLVKFNRFRNENISGSYIFANEEESQSIRDNFSDVFTDEGEAFFAYEAGSGIGEDVVRFRNLNGSGYIFALGAEAQNIRENFSDVFAEEGVAFESIVA